MVGSIWLNDLGFNQAVTAKPCQFSFGLTLSVSRSILTKDVFILVNIIEPLKILLKNTSWVTSDSVTGRSFSLRSTSGWVLLKGHNPWGFGAFGCRSIASVGSAKSWTLTKVFQKKKRKDRDLFSLFFVRFKRQKTNDDKSLKTFLESSQNFEKKKDYALKTHRLGTWKMPFYCKRKDQGHYEWWWWCWWLYWSRTQYSWPYNPFFPWQQLSPLLPLCSFPSWMQPRRSHSHV